MENSSFVADSELTEYINQSIAEFIDLLVEHESSEFYMTTGSITTASGTQTYSLAADFYEMHKVVVDFGGSTKRTLESYDFDEHGEAKSSTAWGWFNGGPLPRYRVVGSTLYFSPFPSGAYAVTYYYTPAATRLSADGDTFDGVNGWEQWIILDAAIKCLQKEESDVSFLMAQREKLEGRIARHASRRDKNAPSKIRDVRPGRDWTRGV